MGSHYTSRKGSLKARPTAERHLAFLGVLMLSSVAACAEDQSCVKIKTTIESIQRVADSKGRMNAQLLPADTINPGETVIYTVSATNGCKQLLEHAVIGIPIPEHMTYIAGSAVGPGTDVSFSADGGFYYAAADRLVTTTVDGTPVGVSPGEYTHLRWVMRKPLQPGAVAYARFRAIFER